MKYINEEKVNKILNKHFGQFITVVFDKKDASERTLNGRAGVSKYKKNKKAKNFSVLSVYDIKLSSTLSKKNKNKAYRSLPLDRIKEIRAGGKVFMP